MVLFEPLAVAYRRWNMQGTGKEKPLIVGAGNHWAAGLACVKMKKAGKASLSQICCHRLRVTGRWAQMLSQIRRAIFKARILEETGKGVDAGCRGRGCGAFGTAGHDWCIAV